MPLGLVEAPLLPCQPTETEMGGGEVLALCEGLLEQPLGLRRSLQGQQNVGQVDASGRIAWIYLEALAQMRFGGGRPPAEQGAQSGEIAQFEVLRQKHEGVGKSHLGGIEEPGAGVKAPIAP